MQLDYASSCFQTLRQAVDQWVRLQPSDPSATQALTCLTNLEADLQRIQQQAQQAATLNRIVRAMRSTLVLDEVLQMTVDQLHEVLGVDRGLVFRPDLQQCMAAHHVSQATHQAESLLGVYCDFYRYFHPHLAAGEPVIISQFQGLAAEVQQSACDCQVQSLLIVPLIHQNQYLGGISLHQCHQARRWTEDEVAFVQSIADHCAIAIHQAELYQQLQTELAERRRAETELRLLHTLTQAIAGAPDFSTALQIALEQICHATGWDYSEVWVSDPDCQTLRADRAYYKPTEALHGFYQTSRSLTFTPGVGLPGRIWQTHQPEWVEDVTTLTDDRFPRLKQAAQAGLKAALGVPILVSDTQQFPCQGDPVLAVLVFFMFATRPEDQRLVDMVSVVATQLGAVLQQKQAEEVLENRVEARTLELRQANERLQEEIDQRGRVEKTLRESQMCLRLLNNISTSLTSGMPAEEVIETTLRQIGRYFRQFRVIYSLLNQSQMQVLYSVQPDTMPSVMGIIADMALAPDYLATLQRREPIIIEDVTQDLRVRPLLEGMLSRHTRAIITVPVQHSAEELGLITFNAAEPHQWSEYEIIALMEIADYLSIALQESQAQQERRRAEAALRESEFKLRAIIDNSTDAITLKDHQGRYLMINPAGAQFLGRSIASVLGQRDEELFSPETGQAIWQADCRVMTSGQVQTYEEYTEVAGVRQVFLSTKAPYLSPSGEVLGVIGICRDITRLKRVEEALRRQLAAIEAASDGIAILNPSGEYIYLNRAHVQMFGYRSAADLLSKTWREVYHPDESQRIEQTVFPQLLQAGHWQGEAIAKRRDGSRFAQGVSLTLLGDGGLVCVCRDITARKQAEERLRLLELAVIHANDAVVITDGNVTNPCIVYVNDAFCQATGYTAREVIGKTPRILQGSKSDQVQLGRIRSALHNHEPIQVELVNYRKDQTEFWVELNIVPLTDQQGRLTHFVAIQRDISDRKWAESALLATQSRLRYLLSSSPAVIYTCKPGGNLSITFISDNITELLGHQVWEYLKHPRFWLEHVHPDDLPLVREQLECLPEREQLTLEYRFHHQDGSYRWLRDTLRLLRDSKHRPMEIIGSILDITERKQAEEQIKASLEEKVVMLKEIHHRVKNNLQVISSLLKLQAGYIKDERSLEVFKESQNRVRAMALVHEKLYQSEDLARTNFVEYVRSLVNDLFRSYAVNPRLVTALIEIEATVRLSIDTAIPCGLIINELVSNSLKYAFTTGQAGYVRISLSLEAPNLYVLLVEDNGCGLPPELNFHQTKTLGLQLVCNLAKQLYGAIEVERQSGTAFKISFLEARQRV